MLNNLTSEDHTKAATSNLRPYETTIALAFAIALIMNSHLENFYSRDWLAGDGLWGNTMFFFISGFGIALSSRFLSESPKRWISRRLTRIYPATWIATFLLYNLIDGNILYPEPQLLRKYLWPTHFTYIGQVAIFYVVGLFLVRLHPKQLFSLGWIVALSIPIILMHIEGNLSINENDKMSAAHLRTLSHFLSNLQTFLLGIWFALRGYKQRSLSKMGLAFFLALIVYLFIKLMVVQSISGSRAYSALIPLSQILAVLTVLVLTHSSALDIVSRSWIWKTLDYISKHTLELYLVHFYFAYKQDLWSLGAPLGVMAVIVLSLMSAVVLKQITRLIVGTVRGGLNKF